MTTGAAWWVLALAGVFEIAWAVGLKYTQGFTKFWPCVWTFGCLVLSFFLLSKAVTQIPLGTAYAVWTGIGAAGTVVAGILLFQEPMTALRMTCLFLIIAGIAGLKLA